MCKALILQENGEMGVSAVVRFWDEVAESGTERSWAKKPGSISRL
jgi:hypothetical protein